MSRGNTLLEPIRNISSETTPLTSNNDYELRVCTPHVCHVILYPALHSRRSFFAQTSLSPRAILFHSSTLLICEVHGPPVINNRPHRVEGIGCAWRVARDCQRLKREGLRHRTLMTLPLLNSCGARAPIIPAVCTSQYQDKQPTGELSLERCLPLFGRPWAPCVRPQGYLRLPSRCAVCTGERLIIFYFCRDTAVCCRPVSKRSGDFKFEIYEEYTEFHEVVCE